MKLQVILRLDGYVEIKTFIDGDLATNSPLKVDDFLMIKFYVHTRTDGSANEFNSIFLKEFGTALLKDNGVKTSKFEGVTLAELQ